MAQHFLLSTEAKTLSTKSIARMSELEAIYTFQNIRWASTNGKPVCSCCGSLNYWEMKATSRYKCKDCKKTYSVTSGTIFAYHKLELRDYLLAIVLFTNAVKGISALRLSRELEVQYKTAFVLAHKIRASLIDSEDENKLSGVTEMDGCYVGSYIRPANNIDDRIDRRLTMNLNPNKRCVIVARERADENSDMVGAIKTKTFVTHGEYTGVINKIANNHISQGSQIHVDGANGYDDLDAWFDMKVGDHSKSYMGENGECSNQAESFFSRFRRMQIGVHHKISNLYLSNYVAECGFREDMRRKSNGTIFFDIVDKVMSTPTHSEWTGYWQGNKRTSERLVASAILTENK